MAAAGCLAGLLFIVTVGFGLFLSATTLRENTTAVVLNSYENAVGNLQAMINRGLNFGRPLHGFVGLGEHLSNAQAVAPGITNIAVYDEAGELVLSLAPVQTPLAEFESAPDVQQTSWKKLHVYGRILRLGSDPASPAGSVVVSVESSVPEQSYRRYLHEMLWLALLIGPLLCSAELGWFAWLKERLRGSPNLPRALRASFLVFLGGAQLVFAGLAVQVFVGELRTASQFSAEISGRFLAGNLELLLHKRVNIERLTGLQAHMESILRTTPDLGGIRVRARGRVLAQAGRDLALAPVVVPVSSYWQTPLAPRTTVAAVEVHPAGDYFSGTVRRMLLDQLTSLAIGFMFLWQLAGFAVSRNVASELVDGEEQGAAVVPARQIALLETGFFLFFCAYDFVMSFVPLVAARLPSAWIVLPTSLHNALPISAEAGLATVAVLVSGLLDRRLGWKRLMYVSILCAVGGAILSCLSTDIILFILARAFSGFGMGMMLMAGQFSVIESAENRLTGLSGVYAALFAGSVCGSAAGGMLYDICSFQVLFALSALMFSAPALTLCHLVSGAPSVTGKAPVSFTGMLRAAATPAFLKPALLVGLPAGMTLTGFLYLTVPTVMHTLSFNQADIGRLFMLYGFCFVFIGPVLSEFAGRCRSQRGFVVLTGCTAGSAIILFCLVPTYAGFAGAVLLMGISQCLLASSMLDYILSLPGLRQLDSALTSSMYRMFERCGQIAGPVLFGSVLVGGLSFLLPVGICLVVAALLFGLHWGKGNR